MKHYLGRHIYGLGAIAYGVIAFTMHDLYNWYQLPALENILHGEILAYIAGVILILGGITIQWKKTMQLGALILGSISLLFSLLWLTLVIEEPLSFAGWGNFFEHFSLVSGALIIYASTITNNLEYAARISKMGYIIFGISVISFALYQLFYLPYTASLVPKWVPPGQMFWAITTTIAFALAAFAILSGRSALLASRLLTVMLFLFGLMVFTPGSFVDPYNLSNWTEIVSNLSIMGAAWIVVDYLKINQSAESAK